MADKTTLERMAAAFIGAAGRRNHVYVHGSYRYVSMDGTFNIEEMLRAALAAAREPGDEAMTAGEEAARICCEDDTGKMVEAIWSDMIDAILAEGRDDQADAG